MNPCNALHVDMLELSSDTGSDLASSLASSGIMWPVGLDEQSSPMSSSPDICLDLDPPITTTTPRKGLELYFPTVHLGKRSCDDILPSSPKRARIQPPPKSSVSDASVLKISPKRPKKPGKSALNKLELNKAVAAGTFKYDKSKWAKFTSKIYEIDPHSEVIDDDPKRAREVLHVKCGKIICMAMVYDISLYKRHIKNCKSQTVRAGMHTLDNGLNFVFRQDGFPSLANSGGSHDDISSRWPCPGLSKNIDSQIENYLLRTTVPSAGGTSIENVARNMYKKAYKELTEAEKEAVRIGQMHTHRWSLDHQRRRVFATGTKPCLRKVTHKLHYDSRSPQPCDACMALLKDCAFRTAIYRSLPGDENRKFTPHLYQAAEIAKISAKHSGLGAIFDKVSLLDDFKQICFS